MRKQFARGRGPWGKWGKFGAAALLAVCAGAGFLRADMATIPDEWVEVQTGELPIILTAPHGGYIETDALPDRPFGSNVRDSRTQELTRKIADAMEERFGGRPHVIILHIRRGKVEANQAIETGAGGLPLNEAAWRQFHEATALARRTIEAEWTVGLLLDIHGLAAARERIELGYRVTGAQLNQSDSVLNNDQVAFDRSSVRDLVLRSPDSFVEVLRGPNSLGTLLQSRGYETIPSDVHPAPFGDPYFTGGYIVGAHGSRAIKGGSVSAIQIEHSWHGVRDSVANRLAYAAVLTECVDLYMQHHYGIDLRLPAATARETVNPLPKEVP